MQADIVHELNDALGTDYELETSWQDMLPEPEPSTALDTLHTHANAASNGAATLLGGDLPSEDESDFSFRCVVGKVALRFLGARRITMSGRAVPLSSNAPIISTCICDATHKRDCSSWHCCTALCVQVCAIARRLHDADALPHAHSNVQQIAHRITVQH